MIFNAINPSKIQNDGPKHIQMQILIESFAIYPSIFHKKIPICVIYLKTNVALKVYLGIKIVSKIT